MFNLRVEMRWPRRAKQSCWGGFASCRGGFRLAASLGRVGGYGERACARVSREASAARASPGGCGSTVTAMDRKPARGRPRPSQYTLSVNWIVLGHPPRTQLFSSAELARWRPRCGAVLWLQRLCYATRLHAEIWAVIESMASVIPGEDLWTDPSKRLSFRKPRVPIVPAAMPVPTRGLVHENPDF